MNFAFRMNKKPRLQLIQPKLRIIVGIELFTVPYIWRWPRYGVSFKFQYTKPFKLCEVNGKACDEVPGQRKYLNMATYHWTLSGGVAIVESAHVQIRQSPWVRW
jgi:hypothetical protein